MKKILVRVVGVVCLGFQLLYGIVGEGKAQTLPASVSAQAAVPVIITPDQMHPQGDVVTKANCIHSDVCTWVNQSPDGSVILGVDPHSPDPATWNGGTVSVTIRLDGYPNPTLLALKISWPDSNGKGLHSPNKNQAAVLAWDGMPVWNMRTLHPGTGGDFYALEHAPLQATLVITEAMMHTLSIAVPAHTAWDISQISLTPYAYPTTLKGIGYSPYRDCQGPGGSSLPTQAQIVEDLNRLAHTSNAVRTYASTGINAGIPALANGLGLRVYAGAWLNPGSDDDAEIAGLIQLANTTPLEGVIVGNEYYLRNRTGEHINYLLEQIKAVKNQIPAGIPVMTAEVDDLVFYWQDGQARINPDYKAILDQVDAVMVHIYPFWSGKPVGGAARTVVDHYNQIKALLAEAYPGQNKKLIIGETGWPSAGTPNNEAVPGLANQRLFMLEFLSLAEQEGVEFFYFDAFDELWKIEEPGQVGQNWGYSYSDRSAKHSEFGVLLPGALLPISSAANALTMTRQNEANLALAPAIWTVYDEWPEEPASFVPSQWMGDIDQIGMYACDRSDPYRGEMAIRASFSPNGTQGWGGVYWQYPAGNSGDKPEGIDLRQANLLTFWAKGEKGGEKIRFAVGGIGTQDDPYPESLRPAVSTGYVTLSNEWQAFTINLVGQDLTHVIGGFGWVTDQCASPQGAVFYLDKIQFEYDASLKPPPPHGDTLPIYTDAAAQDNHFVPSGFMDAASNPENISLNECWYENPHRGSTSIRIEYTHKPAAGQYGGGVYWLEPANNWGDRPGGIDLTGVKRLTFWARSDAFSARLKFLVGGVGYVNEEGTSNCSLPATGQYPDSVCPTVEKELTLTTEWQRYYIDLSDALRDYHQVVGGFGFYAQQNVTFYLDDILYHFDGPNNVAHTMPVDIAIHPETGLAYVVNQGLGNLWVLNSDGYVQSIDLPAAACPKTTPYGTCLNAVNISPYNGQVYVSQWVTDKLHIINNLELTGWVYGGQGPAGAVTGPESDTVYALDKWNGGGITVIQNDKDVLKIPSQIPNAGCINPVDHHAYIANTAGDNVFVIQDATLAATITVGTGPNAIACALDGTVYAVNSGATTASVSVISGAVVTATIPIGRGTKSLGVDGFWGTKLNGSTNILAINDQTGDVYISNWKDDTVSIINHTTWITDIAVGHHPNAIGIYQPTNTVYVANTLGDSVTVLRDRQVIATIAVGFYPIALAVNPATGDVYVANRDSNSVTILRDTQIRKTVWLFEEFLPFVIAEKFLP